MARDDYRGGAPYCHFAFVPGFHAISETTDQADRLRWGLLVMRALALTSYLRLRARLDDPYEDGTCEPRSHLKGCEDLLDQFEQREKGTRSAGAGSSSDPIPSKPDPAGSSDDPDGGDDPDEDYQNNIAWWYRDVSALLRNVPELSFKSSHRVLLLLSLFPKAAQF